MGCLMELKKQLVVVEAKCKLLRNLALNLPKGDQPMASNQRRFVNSSMGEFKEEEIVHQFDEEMVTVNQEINPTSTGLDDVASHYALC